MTISLDTLERLAQASSMVLGGSRRRWLDRYDLEHMDMPQRDREFIAACDPGTVLRLIAVAKAAHESEYAVTIEQCMEADCVLRKALAALDAP